MSENPKNHILQTKIQKTQKTYAPLKNSLKFLANSKNSQNLKIQRVAFKAESKSQAVAFLFKEKASKKPKSRLKSRAKSQLHTQKAEPRKK